MFLGFTEGVKGFRLWHPVEKRCLNSRDVTFREQDMYMLQAKSQNEITKEHNTSIEVEESPQPSTA